MAYPLKTSASIAQKVAKKNTAAVLQRADERSGRAFFSCGTLSSAAALGQEAIMPFMLKTKNIGIVTPRTLPILKNANANSTLAASATTQVETTSRRFSAWCFTSFLFAKLNANAHDVYAE